MNMGWSARIVIVMVTLTVVSASFVGWFAYYNVEKAALPAELARLDARVAGHAKRIEAYVDGVGVQLLGLLGEPVMNAFVRASVAGGRDPLSDMTTTTATAALRKLFRERLNWNVSFDQLRLIDATAEGRELVRIDRSGPGGQVRDVIGSGLQSKGMRPYVALTRQLEPGSLYISGVDLNKEFGVVDPRRVPVLRVATPVYRPDGTVLAILVANVDMRPALAPLVEAGIPGGAMYALDAEGTFLAHPDASQAFQAAGSAPVPDWLGGLLAVQAAEARVIDGADGSPVGAATAEVRLAGGPPINVVGVLPYAALVGPVETLGRSTLWATAAALVVAMGLALLFGRTLTRPLAEMTRAVLAEYDHRAGQRAPVRAAGEIGLLARTFETLREELRVQRAAVALEIQERERINLELQDRNHEIYSFYQTVSHELKTPLLAAREFVALTRDGVAGEINATQGEYLGIAMECCDRLAVYVNNVLDTVRSETGRLKLALESCDPRQLVADAFGAMRPLCAKAGLVSELDIGADIPVGELDRARVVQMVHNLVGNSIRFTPDGGSVRVALFQHRPGWVRLTVEDTGCGIPAHQQELIFQRFSQADNQEGARTSGIGIGLSVCRTIARRHGGDIVVESQPGKGSTFTVDLPVSPAAHEETPAEPGLLARLETVLRPGPGGAPLPC